jgi:kynurenine formamidase
MSGEAVDLGAPDGALPPDSPLWERVARAQLVDLAQPFERGMPQSPNAPTFRLSLERRHHEQQRLDGGSMSNEIIVTGGHIGTHVDALAHVSHHGMLHGHVPAAELERAQGFSRLGIEEFPPFVGRAVLLDVAALHGVDVLPAAYEITVAELEEARKRAAVELRPGDAVLIGTGWSRRWEDGADFAGVVAGAPGPGAEAGRWLASHAPAMVGGETIAFEHLSPETGLSRLPVHTIMLVDAGIYILETMRLRDLLDARVTEFTLVVNPLPLVGATGAPVRPLALLDR